MVVPLQHLLYRTAGRVYCLLALLPQAGSENSAQGAQDRLGGAGAGAGAESDMRESGDTCC